jgi:hypothetical protein
MSTVCRKYCESERGTYEISPVSGVDFEEEQRLLVGVNRVGSRNENVIADQGIVTVSDQCVVTIPLLLPRYQRDCLSGSDGGKKGDGLGNNGRSEHGR